MGPGKFIWKKMESEGNVKNKKTNAKKKTNKKAIGKKCEIKNACVSLGRRLAESEKVEKKKLFSMQIKCWRN